MPDTGAIEVVMTSGQISPDIEMKATEAGCRRCVTKPIKLDTLLGLVGLEAGLGAHA
jgi:CheY-like chemotaxis protein